MGTGGSGTWKLQAGCGACGIECGDFGYQEYIGASYCGKADWGASACDVDCVVCGVKGLWSCGDDWVPGGGVDIGAVGEGRGVGER